jgi:hypothetical protein
LSSFVCVCAAFLLLDSGKPIICQDRLGTNI